MDTLHAESCALGKSGLPIPPENSIRAFDRSYALGCVEKAYTINFLDPDNDRARYCNQIVCLAYKKAGINLNVGKTGGQEKWFDMEVYPQEIFNDSILDSKEMKGVDAGVGH